MQQKRWTVEIFIDEHDGTTRAEARLVTRDETHLVGTGTARRNPHDIDVPEIGDELAVSRALNQLARTLLDASGNDIAAIKHLPVHLSN
jgi:hypothetical protein